MRAPILGQGMATMCKIIYSVYETFHSVQGEGINTGIPMFFIRFAGCNVQCGFCDQPEALLMSAGIEMSFDALLQLAEESGCQWVCLTGGEPTLQKDLDILVHELRWRGMSVAIETNGTGPIPALCNWVTLSPKPLFQDPEEEAILRADEVKWLVGSHLDIVDARRFAANNHIDESEMSLQPLWGIEGALELCLEACKDLNWRLSIQLHKYLGVD